MAGRLVLAGIRFRAGLDQIFGGFCYKKHSPCGRNPRLAFGSTHELAEKWSGCFGPLFLAG
uniref:Uncharacterized protein n=1 Tax=Zea mays TaxID=4577 RepID=C4J6A6_MAIZE|nr:unknown [Zea mays]